MNLKLDLDIEQFWKDDELAHKDNCFSPDAPQVALGIRMSHECVFSELGVEGHPWDPIDPIRQAELNKRYNDKAEKIVGRRLLPEKYTLPAERFPEVKRIGEGFGSRYEYINHSEWLHRCCETPAAPDAASISPPPAPLTTAAPSKASASLWHSFKITEGTKFKFKLQKNLPNRLIRQVSACR